MSDGDFLVSSFAWVVGTPSLFEGPTSSESQALEEEGIGEKVTVSV